MNSGMVSFLQGEALANSVIASLGRARVYREGLEQDHPQRATFRNDLKRLLLELAADYTRSVCDGLHIANIEHVADEITIRHRGILRGGRFRFGVAQKALNLFLKYAWALGLLPVTPPHCPFDRTVLEKLSIDCCKPPGPCNWTEMDCSDCYRKWVNAARAQRIKCGTCTTLSDWEHCVWRRSKTPATTRQSPMEVQQ